MTSTLAKTLLVRKNVAFVGGRLRFSVITFSHGLGSSRLYYSPVMDRQGHFTRSLGTRDTLLRRVLEEQGDQALCCHILWNFYAVKEQL